MFKKKNTKAVTTVKPPIYKRKWFIGLIIVFALGLVFGGGSDDEPAAESETTAEVVVQEDAVPEPEEPEPADEPEVEAPADAVAVVEDEPEPDLEPVQETAEENDGPTPADASDLDTSGFTSDDKIYFSIIMDKYGDKYYNGWDTPSYAWSRDQWTMAKWDDNGAVVVSTSVSFEGVSRKQTAFLVLTPEFYGMTDNFDRYTVHYFQVGNDVCINDGYADEVLEKLSNLTD